MGFRTTPVAVTVPFNNSANGFASQEVQSAIEEAKATAEGKARFSIPLINNGTVGNGQRMAYSELLPNTPVIVPRNCILREVSFANNAAVTDVTFNFYVRPTPAISPTPTGLTAFNTWVLTNTLTSFLTGLSQAFTAGQECLIVATDTGDNASDAVMVLFFQVS